VFGDRVLRKIFGPKRDEVTEDLRRMHNEELNDLYCGMYGREERSIQGFGGATQEKGTTWKTQL
jgi:hypothetical protein